MLRRSFLPPIPEFSVAADLLSSAADALIAGDISTCATLLIKADLRPLREFAFLLAGPINPEIHRQSKNPKFIPVPKENRPRMPNASQAMAIMTRDGFRCRFCQSRVVVKEAHRIFSKYCPIEARIGNANEKNHFGLATLTASIDHLLPYSSGGTNDPTNLVTACGPCQYGRNQWTIEEVEILNPFQFPPIVDEWDGLTRLTKLKK